MLAQTPAVSSCPGVSGASPLTPRVDVDKEDWTKIDAWIDAATTQLAEAAAAGRLQSFAELGGVAAVVPGSGASAVAAAGYSKSRPYYARVVSVEGLCVLSNPDDKDTVKLELQLEPEALAAGGLAYTPGDALGIWPCNPPQVCVCWGGCGVRADREGVWNPQLFCSLCSKGHMLRICAVCCAVLCVPAVCRGVAAAAGCHRR